MFFVINVMGSRKRGGVVMSAIMNTVYNNYLTAYTPKTITKYDTHKKSELKNVCASIAKINKESPWYLPVTSKETQNYAVNLKENARQLHHTIAQLGGLEDEDFFDKKSAYSTDEDVVAVSYIGSQQQDEDVPEVELEVQKLASSQENLGTFLPANEKVDLVPDTYSFDVAINDMNYEFQFSVGEDETNRELQERLVRLINNSNIGLKSELVESDGRTSLRLTSEASGLKDDKTNIFSISDNHTSKSTGTVDYFGIDYVSREPSNAEFLLNGEQRSSSSNHFTLGKMFDVQLKGVNVEGESVKIGLKTDVDSLTDNISNLIGGYNDFLKAVSSYLSSQTRSRQLMKELNGITNYYSSSFNNIGVSVTEDGTLGVDTEKLRETAMQSESISKTFDYVKDFSNALLRKSDQVSINPMDYVERKIVAYKNPGHNFASSYSTSAYTGMMFNSYC